MDTRATLDILVDAVLAGAVEVLRVKQRGPFMAEYKDATELVTEADKRSDAAIRAVLERRMPGDVQLRLEESGVSGGDASCRKVAGADPIDGTNHFACGGNLYSIQAHYMEDGEPLIGVLFQPEAYLPSDQTPDCAGRLAWAIHGEGAWLQRSCFRGDRFDLESPQVLRRGEYPPTRGYIACVPVGTKMTAQERALGVRVRDSAIVASSTGIGCAGGNIMMTILGGQQVYANFGAGDELDLVPPQVIAEEAGLTVWGMDRQRPIWKDRRKQPMIVAPTPAIAEAFFVAAGL